MLESVASLSITVVVFSPPLNENYGYFSSHKNWEDSQQGLLDFEWIICM